MGLRTPGRRPRQARDWKLLMPKMKTHKGTAKRVKITGTGKVLMNAHHRGHTRLKKPSEKPAT